ncbi:hypothetical protein ARMGADRAFT_1082705 [Armillaria gallica]|uniref:Fungal-type protein kinase domain-containing protein n=1 Tax=Armillaria gallica TaxID=47427 RepID=A0A2H3DHU4_ARMGA|nr:hypothetical protein ARMGADRAFT_1082705 [Armillaria gallica]
MEVETMKQKPSPPKTTKAVSNKKLTNDPRGSHRYTIKDAQLGSYILECFLANYRMFVIALSLKNYDVILWYYDSISALHSIPFNFLHDPRCLILVLHCMNEASSVQLDRGQSPEIVLINEIRTATPELKEYLPQIFFDCFYNSEMDLHLPCFNLNIQFNKLKMRDLMVIIAESCYELWMVDSLEEFKTAFVNIFECHHRVFAKGRILHGAITSIKKHHVLSLQRLQCYDTDMVIPSEVSHRPCISPFTATDLLDITIETPHRYCHDLESFFYVLLWAGVHFDLKNHKEKPTDELFTLRNVHTEADFTKAHDNKSEIWHNDGRLNRFKSCFTEDFIPLWDEWVTPLRELFYDAQEEEKRIRAQTPDQETLNGILTFEKFMGALG